MNHSHPDNRIHNFTQHSMIVLIIIKRQLPGDFPIFLGDNSGGGDFGLHFVPGSGKHCELGMDGVLWHAAASLELLADVLSLPRWCHLDPFSSKGWAPWVVEDCIRVVFVGGF